MIRHATADDFAFIYSIAARAENAAFIVDDPNAEMGGNIAAPDMDLVIWGHDGTPAGFALFCEIGNPSGRVELRRLGLDVTDMGLGQPFFARLD